MHLVNTIKQWLKWHNNWDDLCNQCGKCCYLRRVKKNGEVIINYAAPCQFLDLKTHRCTIFPNRFKICNHCRKVGLWVSRFNKTLPNDCAYRMTFRPWEYKD